MKIKAVVFDLGGVLFNLDKISSEYVKLCKSLGKNGVSPWDDFRKEWDLTKMDKMSCADFYRAIANRLGTDSSKVRRVILDNIQINEDMRKILLKLSKNYKIGILSNIIEDMLLRHFEILNFDDFAEVVASCRDRVKKPNTDAIDLILDKLKVKKEEAVFIDDSAKTIEIYSKYGIKSILFENESKLIKDLSKMGVDLK